MNFVEAAKYGAFSVPILLFNTNICMLSGKKSAIGYPMLKSANISKLPSYHIPAENSHHAIDVMYLVNTIKITADVNDFGSRGHLDIDIYKISDILSSSSRLEGCVGAVTPLNPMPP